MMKSKEEVRKYPKINGNENTIIQKSMGYSKSSSQREIHSHTGLPQEIRKFSNRQPNQSLKRIKKRTNKT